MDIRRLGFAGIEITSSSGASLVIDLLEDLGSMTQFVGPPLEPLPPPRASGSVGLALVTHLHRDHTDPAALAAALSPDGRVLRPATAAGEGVETAGLAGAEHGLVKHGLRQQVVAEWETVEDGPFRVTAVPASDGFGDPQVSWVVEADGVRILHAGDTMMHGAWWLVASRLGPIDVAFLPVNGAVADLPHRQPASPLPVVMDPRQAVTAALLLRTRTMVPIHYGTIHAPPVYGQVDNPAGAAVAVGEELGVQVQVVAPGDEVALPTPAAA